MQADPLRGKTIRWTFDDGPTRGKSFEHTFADDGSVSFRMDGGTKSTRVDRYECARIRQDVVALSYLSESGWTLTVILDEKAGSVVAFASNDKQLIVQHGHWETAARAA